MRNAKQRNAKRTTRWWLNQPIWKNMLAKLDHFPKDPGEHNNMFETTNRTTIKGPFIAEKKIMLENNNKDILVNRWGCCWVVFVPIFSIHLFLFTATKNGGYQPHQLYSNNFSEPTKPSSTHLSYKKNPYIPYYFPLYWLFNRDSHNGI